MENNLNILIKDITENIYVLGLSGLSGIAVKLLAAKDKSWRQRMAQGVAGAAAAIFLGPLLAETLTVFVNKEVYAWLASGFICGYGGETIVAIIINKLGGEKK